MGVWTETSAQELHKTMFSDALNAPPNAIINFCKLNTTSAVSVAKGYNSRLVISHLLKDRAIAKILRAARNNNRNSLARVLRYSVFRLVIIFILLHLMLNYRILGTVFMLYHLGAPSCTSSICTLVN